MQQPDVVVRPIAGKKEQRAFLLFPWHIYRHDPLWVPPILSDRASRIDPQRNPLFDRGGEVALWGAWRGKKLVGTIGGAIDHQKNVENDQLLASFGFFECEHSYATASMLFDAITTWARERGVTELRGPQSFDGSDEPGLLIEGRETPRGMLMGWTPEYYEELIPRYGFQKFHDSFAYRVYLENYVADDGLFHAPGNLERLSDYVRRRYEPGELVLRTADLEHWDDELATALDVYNRAMAVLPDNTPMLADDWARFARSIESLLIKDLTVFLELRGEPVAFALGLPDVNMALLHCNGLRAPWDYASLWWYSRKLPGISFKIMAMVPECHGLGLDTLVYRYIAETSYRIGYEWIDMSLTGEDNPTTNRLVAKVGAQVDKRYRTYSLVL